MNFSFFCSEYYANGCVVVFVVLCFCVFFIYFFLLGLRTDVVDGNKMLLS